jgi:hypothetical protein
MKGAIYMELMTQELETVFPTLYSQEDKDPKDIKVIAKFPACRQAGLTHAGPGHGMPQSMTLKRGYSSAMLGALRMSWGISH